MQRFKLSADRQEELVGADLLLWHHPSSMPKMQNDIHSVAKRTNASPRGRVSKLFSLNWLLVHGSLLAFER